MTSAKDRPVENSPKHRRLRIYALDPSLATSLETAVINSTTVEVPWEDLEIGPVGEYVEVVDVDPASYYVYRPVDLHDHYLLAQDGEEPSEGNPKFHQQMVYAVVSLTIANFERALGRKVLWAPRKREVRGRLVSEYVQRLRVYPHALREANAYYSPEKKALLFGYFPGYRSDPGADLPGGMVFTCLSHDVVAHETTHALLDGIHPLFIEDTNPDVLAFHEAFADLVALFQHFSMEDVLAHQIALTRGDLRTRNLLGQLASQFGHAIGSRGALREYIGRVDPETRIWKRHEPDPTEYQRTRQPHARGALLVAAIFDAFIAIYEKRTEDLVRLGTGGTGVLAEGALHPDLVRRLASEAAKTAQHILRICVRALDYCPPFDVSFGEYLRAMITADRDLVPEDPLSYRIALIEAFRRRGIYPRRVRTLSEASLKWHPAPDNAEALFRGLIPDPSELQSLVRDWDYANGREEIYDHMETQKKRLQARIEGAFRKSPKSRNLAAACREMGLDHRRHRLRRKSASIEVPELRVARRIAPDGEVLAEVVATIVQRRPLRFTESGFECKDTWSERDEESADAWFFGGCTLLIDVKTGRIRYSVSKSINSGLRQERQAAYQKRARALRLAATYFGQGGMSVREEPFGLLHRFGDEVFEHE